MDATSIANAIQNGEITSHEAVTAYIGHIKNVNSTINAMVEDRFTEALAEAKEMDKNENRENMPLYGVPISVKESFHVAGLKTTGGLEHRQDLIARENAAVVAKLKKAGAIILGKTNTPALCFCQETENKLYGRTNNPWDVSRTPGGSSGGEGALLGAGGAAVGIGSDIGGSIRLPSHFNGVIGFKPGMYQVSDAGHFPAVQHPLQKRMQTVGPMGKTVRDMELMYRIIRDNTTSTRPLQDFNIEILPGNTNYPLSERTKDLLDQIEVILAGSYPTSRVIPPYFKDSAQLWQEMMSIQGSKLVQNEAFNNDRSNVLKAYLKEKLTQRTTIHPYLSWALLGSKLFKPSISRVKEVEGIIDNGDDELAAYLDNRLLIFPVYHSGALHHGKVYNEIFSIRKTFLTYMPYVAYANVWGLPSLTIPVGTDENDMPVSVQIMSGNGNEDAVFQIGKILEAEFRGYVRSDKSDNHQFA
ncbi:amidase [Virgibacillus natechei]